MQKFSSKIRRNLILTTGVAIFFCSIIFCDSKARRTMCDLAAFLKSVYNVLAFCLLWIFL